MEPSDPSTRELFVPSDADGTRARLGIVGVDSGTMAIGGDHFGDLDQRPEDRVIDNIAFSSTGYGDGGYSVLGVSDPAGGLIGVEVVFLSEHIDDHAEKEATESGLTLSEEVKHAVWDHTATDAQKQAYDRYYREHQDIFQDCWDRLEPLVHPADAGTPKVLGTIAVEKRFAIGDPCYGAPTCHVEVPAGTYVAVAWEEGGYTARLAAYLLHDER